MKRVALLGCTSQKHSEKAKAEELYKGSLFKLSLAYARKSCFDEIMILSAKHGLLELNMEIEPYNLTLKNMPNQQVRLWAQKVLAKLTDRFELRSDHFVFFVGHCYRRYLVPQMTSFSIPMEGLSIGQQLHYLKERL